jgi:UvrD-like helicase C-terminal domain
MIYRQLKSPVEATVSEPAIGPLGPSRQIVFTLAALFGLDSFGGGFFVQSLLALWLFDHFGLSLTAAGSLFFWSGLLSALSYPVAVRLARRIGLVNTMVFTHLPSNVCLADSHGRRNTLKDEVAMRKHRRRSDRSGRAPLFSPGRPPVAGRDERRRFWAVIAAGVRSEDAAIEVGVSQAVGARWFRKAGGMPPSMFGQSAKPLSGRIFRLRSGRRSRFFGRRATPCRRSPAGLNERRRRSPGSCGAMPPLGAADWSIARRRRNGTPSEPLSARSRRSLRSTRHCEPMWRNDWQESSSLRAGLLFPVRLCPGKAVGMDRGRTAGGQTPGARSRSPAACRSTSRTMRRCASAMRPFIKRCSFKAEVRCAASWRPACVRGLMPARTWVSVATFVDAALRVFGNGGYDPATSSDLADDAAAWQEISREITHQLGRNPSLDQFLQELGLRSKEPSPKSGSVTLMTIHAAKGREFDFVYVIGLEHGLSGLDSGRRQRLGSLPPRQSRLLR